MAPAAYETRHTVVAGAPFLTGLVVGARAAVPVAEMGPAAAHVDLGGGVEVAHVGGGEAVGTRQGVDAVRAVAARVEVAGPDRVPLGAVPTGHGDPSPLAAGAAALGLGPQVGGLVQGDGEAKVTGLLDVGRPVVAKGLVLALVTPAIRLREVETNSRDETPETRPLTPETVVHAVDEAPTVPARRTTWALLVGLGVPSKTVEVGGLLAAPQGVLEMPIPVACVPVAPTATLEMVATRHRRPTAFEADVPRDLADPVVALASPVRAPRPRATPILVAHLVVVTLPDSNFKERKTLLSFLFAAYTRPLLRYAANRTTIFSQSLQYDHFSLFTVNSSDRSHARSPHKGRENGITRIS